MISFWLKDPLRMPVGKEGSGGEGSGQGAATFDAAAFETKILGEMNKAINGIAKDLKKEIAKLSTTGSGSGQASGEGSGAGGGSGEGAGDGSATGSGAGQGTGGGSTKITDPAINAELQLLRKQVSNLEKANKESAAREKAATEARLESERQTSIRNVLNGIEFRDQESRDLVFQALNGSIKRDEEGNLVAQTADGPISYDAHIKAYAEKFPALLAPKGGGGSGATGGTRGTGKAINIDTMSVEQIAALKPEERAEIYRDLAQRTGAELASASA